MRWRQKIAELAGMPPLDLMEGFYRAIPGDDCMDPIYWARKGLNDEKAFEDLRARLPIKWDALKPSPLHKLLYHSDCDGEIAWQDCGPIADALQELLPKFPNSDAGGHIGFWRDKTSEFIVGCRRAFEAKENLIFH